MTVIHTEYQHAMLALCDHLHTLIKRVSNEHLEYIAWAIDMHLIEGVKIQPATLDDLGIQYAKTQDLADDELFNAHLQTIKLINRIHTHL